MPGNHRRSRGSDQLRYLAGDDVPSYAIGGAQAYGGNTGMGAGSAYSGASNQQTSSSMSGPSGGGSYSGNFQGATGGSGPAFAANASTPGYTSMSPPPFGVSYTYNPQTRLYTTVPQSQLRQTAAPAPAQQQPQQMMYSRRFNYRYPKVQPYQEMRYRLAPQPGYMAARRPGSFPMDSPVYGSGSLVDRGEDIETYSIPGERQMGSGGLIDTVSKSGGWPATPWKQ